jgi:hypothetical protein
MDYHIQERLDVLRNDNIEISPGRKSRDDPHRTGLANSSLADRQPSSQDKINKDIFELVKLEFFKFSQHDLITQNHPSTSFWRIESEEFCDRSPLEVEKTYFLRHYPTGKYLGARQFDDEKVSQKRRKSIRQC